MKLAVFILVAVVMLAAAVGGTLMVSGVVPVPWAAKPAARRLAPGSAMCPVGVRDVRAYSAITAEDLVDPQSNRPLLIAQSVATLAAADPPLPDARQIVGRVLRSDLPAGSLFHESDFYPPGTAPGAAAGVPVGKRAITLDAAAVSGTRDLRAGDHVDLDAAQPINMDPSKLRLGPGTPVPPMATRTAAVRHLARNAVVVQPLTVRQVPYMMAGGLTSGARPRTRPIEELTIAVDPAEVAAVEQAVASGSDLSCLLHSGQPTTGAAAAAISDGTADVPQFAPVEQIVGDKHTLKYVPLPGGRP